MKRSREELIREVHKARYILYNNEDLSKKLFDWRVPVDLRILSKDNNDKTFVRIGHWVDTGEKYLCIGTHNKTVIIHKKLFRKLIQAMDLDGVEFLK